MGKEVTQILEIKILIIRKLIDDINPSQKSINKLEENAEN